MRRPNPHSLKLMGQRIAREIDDQVEKYGVDLADEVAWLNLIRPIEQACFETRNDLDLQHKAAVG